MTLQQSWRTAENPIRNRGYPPFMATDRVLAAVLIEPGRYELQEYPLPEPAPGCVLVKMELSGICSTDKHTYQGFTMQYAGAGEGKQIRFPITKATKM